MSEPEPIVHTRPATAVDARGGRRMPWVLWVLAISTGLAIVAMIVAFQFR